MALTRNLAKGCSNTPKTSKLHDNIDVNDNDIQAEDRGGLLKTKTFLDVLLNLLQYARPY